MKPSIWVPEGPSKAYKKRNQHLYLNDAAQLLDEHVASVRGSPKRIRQNQKLLMNKLESEWFEIISAQFPNYPRPRAQAKRYRLGNGVVFTPDFTSSLWPNINGGPALETAWEIKGQKSWDDAIVKIKLAPTIWPEVQWLFCYKENGAWKVQKMLA